MDFSLFAFYAMEEGLWNPGTAGQVDNTRPAQRRGDRNQIGRGDRSERHQHGVDAGNRARPVAGV